MKKRIAIAVIVIVLVVLFFAADEIYRAGVDVFVPWPGGWEVVE